MYYVINTLAAENARMQTGIGQFLCFILCLFLGVSVCLMLCMFSKPLNDGIRIVEKKYVNKTTYKIRLYYGYFNYPLYYQNLGSESTSLTKIMMDAANEVKKHRGNVLVSEKEIKL